MLGDAKSKLFIDDLDRERFLGNLADRLEQFNVRLYMFVLMTNHFHLVFETPEGNCSNFMQSLLTAYTVYYNLRHRRHGHVFDGRFKAKLVDGGEEGNDYLLALSRYVHLNPVRVGSIEGNELKDKISYLRSYIWSSYGGYAGLRKPWSFVEYEPVLAMTGGKKGKRAALYRTFVESGIAETDEEMQEALKASPRSIGGDRFRIWVDDLYARIMEDKAIEDVSFRKITEPLAGSTILQAVAEVLGVEVSAFQKRLRRSPLRAVACTMLLRYGGLSQREVAQRLAMGTGAAVSLQVKRFLDMVVSNKALGKSVALIEKKLADLKADKC